MRFTKPFQAIALLVVCLLVVISLDVWGGDKSRSHSTLDCPPADGFDFPVGENRTGEYNDVYGWSHGEKNRGYDYLEKGDYWKLENGVYVPGTDGVLDTWHPGEDWNIDYDASRGENGNKDEGESVYPVAPGRVVYAGPDWRNGLYHVVIEHECLSGCPFVRVDAAGDRIGSLDRVWSVYAHLGEMYVTEKDADGRPVFVETTREPIGTIGPYPRGAHLHFEIWAQNLNERFQTWRPFPKRTDFDGKSVDTNGNGKHDYAEEWDLDVIEEYYIDPTEFIQANRPKTITVFTPNHGDPLLINGEYCIHWTSRDVQGRVRVHLYKDGGHYLTLGASEENDGSLDFFVDPNYDWEPSNHYMICICNLQGSIAGCSAEFTIMGELADSLWHPNGTLTKTVTASTVYLIDNNRFRPFINEPTFFSYHYGFDQVVTVSDNELRGYVVGTPMPQVKRTVFWIGSTVWMTDEGTGEFAGKRKRVLDRYVLESWGFTMGDVEERPELAALPPDGGLHFRPGTLITSSSPGSTAVYVVVDEGMLRPIDSEVTFNRLGYRWDQIVEYPDDALESLAHTFGVGDMITQADLSTPPSDRSAPQVAMSREDNPYKAGQTLEVTWLAYDNVGVSDVFLAFTADGWQSSARVDEWSSSSYTATTSAGPVFLSNGVVSGTFEFDLPDVETAEAELRIVAIDGASNVGYEYSQEFSIVADLPVPSEPELYDLGTRNVSGCLGVYWSGAQYAESYVLQECTDGSFTSPATYETSSRNYQFHGKANGHYYYRVRAENTSGASGWSNVEDIEVRVNKAPEQPHSPSPSDGQTGVGRNVTLCWEGTDPEGDVEFAVYFGTSPSSLDFLRGYDPAKTLDVYYELDPGKQYFWQILARDDEGLVTESDVFSFMTGQICADLLAGELQVEGDVVPGGDVTLRLTIENVGNYASEGCQAEFYYSLSAGAKDHLFRWATVNPTALEPGESDVYTTTVTLDDLTTGDSHLVAEVETVGYFLDCDLGNNIVSTMVSYTDSSAPSVNYIELLSGWGPDRDRYNAGWEYTIAYDVTDDVSVETIDIEYSTDDGESWTTIEEGHPVGSDHSYDGYDWIIPESAAPSSEGRVKVTAHDGSGNSGSKMTDLFKILEWTLPSIEVISPNGDEVWDLNSEHDILWEASADCGIRWLRIYLHYGTQVDFLTQENDNDGSWPWTIPNSSAYETNSARIKIVACDNKGRENTDYSDRYFRIINGANPPPPPWHTPEVITSVPGDDTSGVTENHEESAIAAASDGGAHLVYKYIWTHSHEHQITQTVYYARQSGESWSSPEEVYSLTQSTESHYHCLFWFDLAEDSQGHVHVVWQDMLEPGSDGTQWNQNEVYYTSNCSGNWSEPMNLSDNSTDSRTPRICADSASKVHVVWPDGLTWQSATESTGGFRIYWRYYDIDEASWSDTSEVTEGGHRHPAYAGTAVDGSDYLLLAYRSTGERLRYKVWDGSSWSSPETVYTGDDPTGIAVVADANDSSHLAWERFYWDEELGYYRKALMYASRQAGEWGSAYEVASPESNHAQYFWPSIMIDSDGYVHFVWREQITAQVTRTMYRAYTASGWSTPVQVSIDGQRPTRDGTSACLAGDNTVHIVWVAPYDAHDEVWYNWADVSYDSEPPTVEITCVESGQVVSRATEFEITWNASDNNAVAAVKIEFSEEGEDFTVVAEGEDNDGTYAWNVPDVDTEEARLKISAEDYTGNETTTVSDTFIIRDTSPPVVTLLSPNGGERWKAETAYEIDWTASDNVGVASVELHYTLDNGQSWVSIADEQANTPPYEWHTPGIESSGYKVKVTASDNAGLVGEDVSDSGFEVFIPNNPPVTPHSPVPADGAQNVGMSLDLSWSGGDPDSADSVEYEVFLGTSESELDDLGTTSQTTYSIAELSENTTYYWRIEASDGKDSSQGPVWEFSTGFKEILGPSGLSAITISPTRVDLGWVGQLG